MFSSLFTIEQHIKFKRISSRNFNQNSIFDLMVDRKKKQDCQTFFLVNVVHKDIDDLGRGIYSDSKTTG